MFLNSQKRHFADCAEKIDLYGYEFPQLQSLCEEYSFAVFRLYKNPSVPDKYLLCDIGLFGSEDVLDKITPEFSSLVLLEKYTITNRVELLEKYLFSQTHTPGISIFSMMP